MVWLLHCLLFFHFQAWKDHLHMGACCWIYATTPINHKRGLWKKSSHKLRDSRNFPDHYIHYILIRTWRGCWTNWTDQKNHPTKRGVCYQPCHLVKKSWRIPRDSQAEFQHSGASVGGQQMDGRCPVRDWSLHPRRKLHRERGPQ